MNVHKYMYIYSFHLFISLKFSLDLALNVATFLIHKCTILQTSIKYLGKGKETEHNDLLWYWHSHTASVESNTFSTMVQTGNSIHVIYG